jgi:hypothetical protein
MELSSHYVPFPAPTLIVVTNHERARVLRAEHKTVEEVAEVKGQTSEASGDDVVNLKVLYSNLNLYLQDVLKGGQVSAFRICVPEINRPLLEESLSPEVLTHTAQLIPKNLGNMDLPNIMRILLEI